MILCAPFACQLIMTPKMRRRVSTSSVFEHPAREHPVSICGSSHLYLGAFTTPESDSVRAAANYALPQPESRGRVRSVRLVNRRVGLESSPDERPGSVEHCQSKDVKNRAENSHQPTRQSERSMKTLHLPK